MICLSEPKVCRCVSKGYVDILNKERVYAEIWQIGLHSYELRVKIEAGYDIVYVDINKNYKFRTTKSYVCIDVHIDECKHYKFAHIAAICNHIKFVNNKIANVYQNNKGRYEVDKDYASWCNTRGHQPSYMVL